MSKFLERIVEDALGLVEGYSIDEVFIIEIHVVDARHYAIHLLLLSTVHLLHNVGLIDDLLLVLVAFFTLACHSN